MAIDFVDICEYPPDKLKPSNEPVAIDTETLGGTRETNIPIYFSWAARDIGSGAGPVTTKRGFDFLKKLCIVERPKVFHKASFDLAIVAGLDFEVRGEIHDTLLMHMLLNEHHLEGHALKPLSRELLGRARLDELKLKHAQGPKGLLNAYVPQAILHPYAHADAVDCLDLFYLFKPQLEEQGLWDLYKHEVEVELVYKTINERGVELDLENVEKALKSIFEVLLPLGEKVCAGFGEKFNIAANQQLSIVLSKHFHLTERTPTGQLYPKSPKFFKTDKDTLIKFKSDPRMQALFAWQFLDKARQYLQGYKKRVRGMRLYPNYRQTTITGRAACSNPNLMNIPKQRGRISEVEVGSKELAPQCAEAFRQVRGAITTAPGSRLLSCDYKQIEYRCFAFHTQSERLIAALERGEDFHDFVCKMVFGEVTPQLRYITKIINYGLIYGMGDLLLRTNIQEYLGRDARDILPRYERMLPEMRATQRAIKRVAAQRGYVVGVFGRRYRYLPERPHAIVAWLCQGEGTGSLKKAALVRINKLLQSRRSGIVLDIHDELGYEIYPEDAELVPEIKREMEDFDVLGRIPILVDTAVGPNLLDLKDVSIEEAVAYLRQTV